MFKFEIAKSATKVEKQSVLDLIEAKEAFNLIKKDLAEACASLEEIQVVSDNIDSAISSIEQFGLCAENLSILNADNALDQIVGHAIQLNEIKDMSAKSLEALGDKCLTALEGADESLWDKFCAGVKRVWEAIKRFFVSIWNRIRSLFSEDKDFYKKAMAAYDKLHGDAEKKVDEAVKNCKTDFKGFMSKRFMDTQSLHDNISLEDLTFSIGMSDTQGPKTGISSHDFDMSGSGFIEYSKAKPFIAMWKKSLASLRNMQAEAGGPMEFAIKELMKIAEKAKTVTITKEFIDNYYDTLIDVCTKLPSMKGKVSQASGGVVECTKLEIDLKGRKKGDRLTEHKEHWEDPDFFCEFVIHTKEGTLGQLGWDKKKLIDIYDEIVKDADTTFSDDQIERYCNVIKDIADHVKVSDEDDPDVNEIRPVWTHCVRNLDKIMRQYLKFVQNINSEMLKFRKKLRIIPAIIIKNIDVFAEMSKAVQNDKNSHKRSEYSVK